MAEQPLSEAAQRAIARRERQKAKMSAAGVNRLASISSIAGRPLAAASEADINRISQPAFPQSIPSSATSTPSRKPNDMSHDAIGSLTSPWGPHLGQSPLQQGADSPFGGDPDPQALLRMLMGGGMPGLNDFGGSGGPDMAGAMPPNMNDMFAQLLQQGGAGMPGGPTAPVSSVPPLSNGLWKVVHAISAFAVGIYLALSISFRGTYEDRLESNIVSSSTINPLVMFTTMELVLQTTRFLSERNTMATQPGMLNSIAAFIPPPYGDYLRSLGRYGTIYSTIVSDAFCIIFVFGVIAWWHSLTDNYVPKE